MAWYQDRLLWAALASGLLLRCLPLILWMDEIGCSRDECAYLKIAARIAAGDGMTDVTGWLWPPGLPYLLAAHDFLLGDPELIRLTQVVVAMFVAVLVYRLGERVGGRPTARIGAWLYCLSPTMAFFSISLWAEFWYGACLLVAVMAFDRARDCDPLAGRRGLGWALLLGVAIGCCVLLRGVAMYVLPVFVVMLAWGRFRSRPAWMQGLVMIAATVVTVAPYSIYASLKFDGLVIADRSLGTVMFQGNNAHPPIAFDWGHHVGRPFPSFDGEGAWKPCGDPEDVLERDSCMTAAGMRWILEHPAEFVGRMPLRVAGLLNPHSYLTRSLREDKVPGLSPLFVETLIVWNMVWSLVVILAGSLGLSARVRDVSGSLVAGVLLYHVAVIAVLVGMTRYRVPLEPLLMIYAAKLFAEPGETWRAIRGWRAAVVTIVMIGVVSALLWFLPLAWS